MEFAPVSSPSKKERRAKEQSELSRRIGQSVKDIEWVARTAYLLPLHDASRKTAGRAADDRD